MGAILHSTLPCGIEFGAVHLPHRHVVSIQLRVLSGYCSEPPDRLGLARIVEETIDKGTATYSGRQLSDAFDAIGATRSSGTGRETTTCTCTVLPEHFERAVGLHAELLRRPTFPEDAVRVAVDLARQELSALEDDAHGLLDKFLSHQAYGPLLGRHPLGEPRTLDRIDRGAVENHWRTFFQAGRMLVTVAGPIPPASAAEVINEHFHGFGSPRREGRLAYPIEFKPHVSHYDKKLEQQQIGVCWPGVEATHDDFPVQQLVVGILAGGMSGRLFTEVREKRGLVYWVSAWQETPRGTGMMFMGASTTPERCEQTYSTLLREVDRLSEDIAEEELDRAKTGILAGWETRGDTTRSRCAELAGDLFYYGRPLSVDEKVERIKAVRIGDIKRYLADHPRDRLCVVTLGPRTLGAVGPAVRAQAAKGAPSG
jgi:predicted Zn-dependent peptidase